MRWTILILVVFSACSKPAEEAKPESKPIAPANFPDPSAPTAAAARSAPTPKGPQQPGVDVRQLVGAMEKEAENRPKAGILAEQLFDAIEEKAGLKIAKRTQFMGSTWNAAFCAGGPAQDHIRISMCEYVDDKTAQASMDRMNKYINVPDNQRFMRKAAVMTIVGPKDDPRIVKAIATFESL